MLSIFAKIPLFRNLFLLQLQLFAADGTPVLPKQDFSITQESDRAVTHALTIPASAAGQMYLRIGSGHGYYDSGDRGALLSASGR